MNTRNSNKNDVQSEATPPVPLFGFIAPKGYLKPKPEASTEPVEPMDTDPSPKPDLLEEETIEFSDIVPSEKDGSSKFLNDTCKGILNCVEIEEDIDAADNPLEEENFDENTMEVMEQDFEGSTDNVVLSDDCEGPIDLSVGKKNNIM